MAKYIYNYEKIEININLNNLNDSSTLFTYFNKNLNKISIYSKKSLNYDKEEILSSDGTYNHIIQCYSIIIKFNITLVMMILQME